jgi:similar to stage IV sporulation protein
MHRKIMLYFQGYVRIRLDGYSPERFINLCNNRGIRLWNLTHREEGYECCLRIADFRQINGIAWKSKVRVRILEKRGFPIFLYQNRKRKGWAAGVLAAFFILYFCSLFLWNISFEGNSEYTDAVLRKFLRESGYQEGIRIDRIVCEDIEKMLRIEYNDITWVSAQISGTCLRIQIKENEVSDRETIGSEPCDIRAEADGTITSIITRSGTPMVKAGDSVAAGDILISGTVQLLNDSKEVTGSHQVAADGDIMAEYTYTYEDSFPAIHETRFYTGRTHTVYELSAFGYSLSLGREPSYERSDCLAEKKDLKLFENYYLPFGIASRTYREYEVYEQHYSEEEAEAIAQERLDRYRQEKAEDGTQTEVVSLNLEQKESVCYVTAVLKASGPIGEPAQIAESEGGPFTNVTESGIMR